MADYYTKLSFQFPVNASEGRFITWATSQDWDDDDDIEVPPEYQHLFLDRQDFIHTVFKDDPDYAYFALDEVSVQDGLAFVAGWEMPNLTAIAVLIQRGCQDSLRRQPIGFQWCNDCTRARLDGFGGGWCLIQADCITWEYTSERLANAIRKVGAGCKVSPAPGQSG